MKKYSFLGILIIVLTGILLSSVGMASAQESPYINIRRDDANCQFWVDGYVDPWVEVKVNGTIVDFVYVPWGHWENLGPYSYPDTETVDIYVSFYKDEGMKKFIDHESQTFQNPCYSAPVEHNLVPLVAVTCTAFVVDGYTEPAGGTVTSGLGHNLPYEGKRKDWEFDSFPYPLQAEWPDGTTARAVATITWPPAEECEGEPPVDPKLPKRPEPPAPQWVNDTTYTCEEWVFARGTVPVGEPFDYDGRTWLVTEYLDQEGHVKYSCSQSQPAVQTSCPTCPPARCGAQPGYYVDTANRILGIHQDGTPEWYDSYEVAEADGLTYNGSECSLCMEGWAYRESDRSYWFGPGATAWDLTPVIQANSGITNFNTAYRMARSIAYTWRVIDGAPSEGKWYRLDRDDIVIVD